MQMRVKTFSATRYEDRKNLGEVVTEWLADARALPFRTEVLQSSDSEYHCLSIIVFYRLAGDAG